MERVLIIGVTGGIGSAMADHFHARGAEVTGLSRATGLNFLQPETIAPAIAAVQGSFDWVWVTTGQLAPSGQTPEKSLSRIDAATMAQVFATNAIGPALVLAQVARVLPRDRPSRVGVLSARVGSIGDNHLGGWHSYRASKAALNQIIRGAAIEMSRSHPQAVVAALHPGTVATRFTANFPAKEKLAPDVAAARLAAVLGGLEPDQSGRFFDHTGAAVSW